MLFPPVLFCCVVYYLYLVYPFCQIENLSFILYTKYLLPVNCFFNISINKQKQRRRGKPLRC